VGRRVAITGVSSQWGAALARRLERDPAVSYIAGIDSRPPPPELVATEFIEADLRSSSLSRLLPSTEVDTVVHCGILWYPEPGRPPRVLHEINVIGTLQLLAACERTESLRSVVGELDVVALHAQRALEDLGDLLIVLDDENADGTLGGFHAY